MTQTDKIRERISILEEQHARLDREIQEAFNEYTDDDTLAELKREKLRIKDTLVQLRKQCA